MERCQMDEVTQLIFTNTIRNKMKLEDLKKPLSISDIDFRIQSINKGGYATILAYKDARVDMNRLDEVVGAENWQRDHKEIHGVVYCGVGINAEVMYEDKSIGTKIPVKSGFVWKWDAGSESFTDKQKGEASDSFKRACFNWGIGRELYDYPVIQVKLEQDEYTVDSNGKAKATWDLKLKEWKWLSQFSDGKLNLLAAKDQNGKVRYQYGKWIEKLEGNNK